MDNDDDDNSSRFGRYSVFRKNFIRDMLLATLFIMIFAGSFMISWDIWVVPSNYNARTILYCAGFSFLIGIIIIVPINFIIKIVQRAIQNKKENKREQNNEKDFLEQ
jgi:hypothetical protein